MSKTARRLRRSMPKDAVEWHACDDPLAMLEVLRARASDRKVRLFASGCCRLAPAGSIPERSLLAVEVAERYADGLAGRDELLRARTNAFQEARQFDSRESEERRRKGDHRFIMTDEGMRMYFLAESVHPFTPFRIGLLRHRLRWDRGLMGIAPGVLRDVLGNPFRRRSLDLRGLPQGVLGLARAIYEERDFDRMPDLAAALESSGCDDEVISHCRQPAEHVRGCWVIDEVLGYS